MGGVFVYGIGLGDTEHGEGARAQAQETPLVMRQVCIAAL